MKANRNASRVTCMMSVGVACLPFAYIGACFAVLALPGAVQIPPLPTNPASNIQVRYISINGEWNRYPDYHGLPEWVFAPIHNYDRTHLRPSFWSGSYPRNQELSFAWLLGSTTAPAKPE